MGVIFAGIAPHGDEIVPELVQKMDEKSKILMNAMIKFSDALHNKNPDLIVIATPHNLRLLGYMGIIATSFAQGVWSTQYGSISVKVRCNREFARKLYDLSIGYDLPVVLVNYGVAEGELSNMCLDWGTIIPLWFIKNRYEESKKDLPPVVIVTPSREIPWENLVKLGELIADVADELEIKTAFIASADQGHAHDPNGPYGYDEASKLFDEYVLDAVKSNNLGKLLKLTPEFIEKAKPDSFWQMLILHGVLKRTKLRNTMNVYECPTYFGMLVAIYE